MLSSHCRSGSCALCHSTSAKRSTQRRSSLRRKSPLERFCNDLLGSEVEDRAIFAFDLRVGLIDEIEDRMRVQVGGNYIPRFLPGGCELRLCRSCPRRVPGFARETSRVRKLRKVSPAEVAEMGRQCRPLTNGRSAQVRDDPSLSAPQSSATA
jgi:hypothetical protein